MLIDGTGADAQVRLEKCTEFNARKIFYGLVHSHRAIVFLGSQTSPGTRAALEAAKRWL